MKKHLYLTLLALIITGLNIGSIQAMEQNESEKNDSRKKILATQNLMFSLNPNEIISALKTFINLVQNGQGYTEAIEAAQRGITCGILHQNIDDKNNVIPSALELFETLASVKGIPEETKNTTLKLIKSLKKAKKQTLNPYTNVQLDTPWIDKFSSIAHKLAEALNKK